MRIKTIFLILRNIIVNLLTFRFFFKLFEEELNFKNIKKR